MKIRLLSLRLERTRTKALSVDQISSLLAQTSRAPGQPGPHPSQNTGMASIVLVVSTNMTVGTIRSKKGRPKMQNLDLTKWLEMVWDALDEQDELKRDHLLNAADIFLQSDTQETESTPFVDGQKTAA
jgi:hypothetical protein